MAASKRVGYAVVGLGHIAQRAILPAFRSSKKAKLVALVSGDEKKQWWAKATEVWPDYDKYQASTDREIPLIVLDPVR